MKTEPKTVREWLEELPDGYREKALKNWENSKEPDLSRAIYVAFDWEETPEGFDFWAEVHRYGSCNINKLPALPENGGTVSCDLSKHQDQYGWIKNTPESRPCEGPVWLCFNGPKGQHIFNEYVRIDPNDPDNGLVYAWDDTACSGRSLENKRITHWQPIIKPKPPIE